MSADGWIPVEEIKGEELCRSKKVFNKDDLEKAEELFKEMSKRRKSNSLKLFDSIPLEGGQTLIFAGESGTGKTWALLNSLISSVLGGKKVYFLSYELPEKTIIERLMSILENRHEDRLKVFRAIHEGTLVFACSGTIIKELFDNFEESKVESHDIGGLEKKSTLERSFKEGIFKEIKEDDVFIMDYLQRINASGDSNRQNVVQEACEMMQNLSVKKEFIFITAAQIRRQSGDSHTFLQTTLSRLRESGGIGNIADYVLGIEPYIPKQNENNKNKSDDCDDPFFDEEDKAFHLKLTKLRILKDRHGELNPKGYYVNLIAGNPWSLSLAKEESKRINKGYAKKDNKNQRNGNEHKLS